MGSSLPQFQPYPGALPRNKMCKFCFQGPLLSCLLLTWTITNSIPAWRLWAHPVLLCGLSEVYLTTRTVQLFESHQNCNNLKHFATHRCIKWEYNFSASTTSPPPSWETEREACHLVCHAANTAWKSHILQISINLCLTIIIMQITQEVV